MGIWGEGDVATAERQMVESSQHVAAPWRYERVPDGTHWSQLEAPERVSALLLDFFADPALEPAARTATDARGAT